MTVSGSRCGGPAPLVPPTGVVLDGAQYFGGGSFLQGLRAGQSAQLTQSTGFAGAVDVLGGNPMLVVNGVVKSADVDGTDRFSGPNPRTAVGQTADGRLLLVVVDGREYGYSAGMTLRQLADFLLSLGSVNAINLDGGGSSTMWLNGVIANRPSDPTERPVSSALVVLPGNDPGEAQLRVAPRTSNAPQLQVQRAPEQPLVSPVFGGTPVAGWAAAAADPGSVGGLSAALAEDGVPLSPDLQRAAAVFGTR
ncbi:MAG: phosphodiester glycosidase family protein [Actinobacteria bacterium]|nr:phosphodiester glycosidase family protein [Actinomycetota bacterium]